MLNAEESKIRIQRPSKTLRELTLEKMRESILNFYFQPGERLVERDLCAQLGVSRTIVREVLRHLESEGLVTILPNRGPIVAKTTPEEAFQIYEIRSALEPMAACAAVAEVDAAGIKRLEAALSDIRAAYESRDNAGVLSATTTFYRALFEIAKRDVAWSIVSGLTMRINRLRSMTIKSGGRDLDGPNEMQAIVDAIKRGDANAAAKAAKAHVDSAANIARAILDGHKQA